MSENGPSPHNYEHLSENEDRFSSLASLLIEEGVALDESEANEIILAEELNRQKIEADLTPEEWELYMKEGYSRGIDETDPIRMYEFIRDHHVRVLRKAKEKVEGIAPDNKDEYQALLEDEVRKERYFPIMLASAPHIEGKVSGTFPGLPTPLMYATSVLDRYSRTDTFPAEKSPEVVRLFNPAEYSEDFENEFCEEIKRTKPRVICISNSSEGHHFAIAMAQIAKQISTQEGFETIVILGGSNEDGSNPEPYFAPNAKGENKYGLAEDRREVMESTFTPYDSRTDHSVDITVAGDGQYALVKLMQIIGNNTGKSNSELLQILEESSAEFSETEGSGNIYITTPGSSEPTKLSLRGTKLDYDSLPYLYHGRIDNDNFFPVFPKELNPDGSPKSYKKTAQVMTAMGCPYACEFCLESLNLYNLSDPRSVENIVKELKILREYGYEAVFFDDSTFTRKFKGDFEAAISGEPTRAEQLLDSLIQLKQEGIEFEWGCQTTFVDIPSKEFLDKMKESGCTYIYFGFEELEEMEPTNKTHRYNKETWKERVEQVLGWSNEVGIRAGISIQLGLRGNEGFEETIGYAAGLYEKGLITKNSIGLNINVTFPGTKQFVELIREGQVPPDFMQKLNRQPNFESAHQLASLSLEKANEIYSSAYHQIGDGLIGVRFSSSEIKKMLESDTSEFALDYYFPKDKWSAYLRKEISALHLNHASLSEPSEAVTTAAERVFQREITVEEETQIFEQAREKAAELIGLTDPSGVAFGRNTTEVASYCFWLAGLKEGDHIVASNAENKSMLRAFQLHMDHGNPEGNDDWSTYPTYYTKRGKKYSETVEEPTGVETTTFDVLNSTDDEIVSNLEKSITKDTKFLMISHVLRDNGRILPIEKMIDRARELKAELNPDDPQIFILVDGAQALGNIDRISFDDIGCDAYVATPHKTMYSTPCGLLYFNPNNPTIRQNISKLNGLFYQDEQVVLDHAFSAELGVKPNVEDTIEVADVNGFLAATEELSRYGYEHGDFSAVSEKRRNLKDGFKSQIYAIAERHGLSVQEAEGQTDFIYSFNIAGIDNRKFVELLGSNNIFVSYINRSRIGEDGTIRVSFGAENTAEQIHEYMGAYETALDSLVEERTEQADRFIDREIIFADQPVSLGTLGWLRKQIASPIGRVAVAAASLATVIGTVSYMLSRGPKGADIDPAFLVMKQQELGRVTQLAQNYIRDYSSDPTNRIAMDREVDYKLEADKYKMLLSLGDERALSGALTDNAVTALSTAHFSEEEVVEMRSANEQLQNPRLKKLLENIS